MRKFSFHLQQMDLSNITGMPRKKKANCEFLISQFYIFFLTVASLSPNSNFSSQNLTFLSLYLNLAIPILYLASQNFISQNSEIKFRIVRYKLKKKISRKRQNCEIIHIYIIYFFIPWQKLASIFRCTDFILVHVLFIIWFSKQNSNIVCMHVFVHWLHR